MPSVDLSKIPEENYGKFGVIETKEGWQARVLRFDSKSGKYVVQQVGPRGTKTLMFCTGDGRWKKNEAIVRFCVKAKIIVIKQFQLVREEQPCATLYASLEEAQKNQKKHHYIREIMVPIGPDGKIKKIS